MISDVSRINAICPGGVATPMVGLESEAAAAAAVAESPTLLAPAEEVTSNKKRVVEVKVRSSSPLFAGADSDILLEAVEISLDKKKKS